MKRLTGIALCLTLGTALMAQQKPMKAYMVADAHLDTQWNWDVQATIRHHIRNTLTQNLFLLKKYPDYIFNFEGAVKYAWMKEYYPQLYNEMKQYVANGRWHLTGSSWDANEVIIGSPESWIRNILLGQTFYRSEFNTESTDVFLPDCFGFPYTMPTLAAHCGLIGFSSQKLGWRTKLFYEGNKRYPFTIGLWQGIDGSRIMMAHGFSYGQRYDDEDLSNNRQLAREIGESPLNQVYRYYGTGDVGGSPTIASVRSVEKGLRGDGPIQIISATSDQLYKDWKQASGGEYSSLPIFNGELTMDVHGNGCYTSQAAMKLYNRQNEHLGDAAERAAVIADWLGAAKYPHQQLTEAWRRVIWHQFHDDLTGTSIPRAYEFSWNDELLSLKSFADVLTHSVSAIARKMDTNVGGQPIVVYNNETFPVTTIVQMQPTLPNGKASSGYRVLGPNGKNVPSQVIECDGRQQLLFEATLPPTGLAVYSVQRSSSTTHHSPLTSRHSPLTSIENSVYALRVNEYGDIVSLIDKRVGKELVAAGQSIGLAVFDDCPSYSWPAWEILKRTLDKAPVAVHDQAEVSVVMGSLRKTIVIKKKYGQSDIVQRIHLYEGHQAPRIDIENEVDWRSSNALLKAVFPLGVGNKKATYDIGLGSVQRGNNQDNMFEVYAHRWTDLTAADGSYGVTIMNDSRYGWDKPDDHTLRLSLLYTPKTNGNFAYQEQQDQGHHVFTYSIMGHQGSLDEVHASQQATLLNSRPKVFFATKHKGELGREFSFVGCDNPHVLVRCLKQAETTDEYVVRVYELGGKSAQTAHLTFAAPIAQVVEADGTEKTLASNVQRSPFNVERSSLSVSINPYGVRTYKIKVNRKAPFSPSEGGTIDLSPDGKTVAASSSVSRDSGKSGDSRNSVSIRASFDRRCFSYNEFRQDANFESGYSYAAELLPADGITDGDVVFRFGEPDGLNGMSCKGQTLQLPAARQLHLLAASAKGDRMATFTTRLSPLTPRHSPLTSQHSALVPFYTGFIGQWGHDGHTEGFLKDARVAYVGTHRHSAADDEPYEYTYMFRIDIPLPQQPCEVQLPNDPNIVIFAATADNVESDLQPAFPLFKTSLRPHATELQQTEEPSVNLLKSARLVTVTGECNDRERATNLVDGNDNTKWCDVKPAPNYVVFDLGATQRVSRWRLLHAGAEDFSYITRTCLLQTRCSESDEWVTVDMFDQNRSNVTDRRFTPTDARFVRLFVVGSTQTTGDATRIYEFELY
jgi:alpha-mannosidase